MRIKTSCAETLGTWIASIVVWAILGAMLLSVVAVLLGPAE
jgi:hypothetical protein